MNHGLCQALGAGEGRAGCPPRMVRWTCACARAAAWERDFSESCWSASAAMHRAWRWYPFWRGARRRDRRGSPGPPARPCHRRDRPNRSGRSSGSHKSPAAQLPL